MNIKMFIDKAIKELIPNKSFRYVGSIVDEKSFMKNLILLLVKMKLITILSNTKKKDGTW